MHFYFLQPPEIWNRTTWKNFRWFTFGTWLHAFCFGNDLDNQQTHSRSRCSKSEKPAVPWIPGSILSASTTKPIPRLLARSRCTSLCSFIIVSRTKLGWLVWRMAITDTTVAKTNLQEKITDTTVWHQCSILFHFFFMPIQRLLKSLWLYPGLLLYRQYGTVFWSCGRGPCMVHCECWSSMFDWIRFSSMNSFVRF